MKRSEIDHIIDRALEFSTNRGFVFPRFAYYTAEDWQKLNKSSQEIIDNMLGWDVTDFGEGNFSRRGLVSFTFRNGNYEHPDLYPKPYCEKLFVIEDGQELPYHFHRKKMEDIINRGGGTLEITVYKADADEKLDKQKPVTYVSDGERFTVPAGSVIQLPPGRSATMTKGTYHQWKGVPGTGRILLFEVSSTNNDKTDNRFLEDIPRLISVEEDTPRQHLLFNDYGEIKLKG